MNTYTSYQEIKVLSCFKMKDSIDSPTRWKVTCLKEFDLCLNKDRPFGEKSFEQVKIVSNVKLNKGSNIVLMEIEEDAEEVNGKLVHSQEIISTLIEDWGPHLDEFNPARNATTQSKVTQISVAPRAIDSNIPFKFETSDLEYDYLSVVAPLNNYDAEKCSDRRIVKNYLTGMGMELISDKPTLMAFQNFDIGMKATFSNYRSNNREYGFAPSLKLEFSGHFFIRENADLIARKIILNFMKKFGAMFHATRVDIRRDIYGASAPFDYFPNFLDKEKYHWSLRSEPRSSFFHEGFSQNATGFKVKTSRYELTSYSRNISLAKKFANRQITKEYYDHYNAIYNGRNVQRLELKLSQKDSCSDFYKMFMHAESYDKDRTLIYTLANFGRNHILREVEDKTRKSRFKENDVFSELFHLKEKENFKTFRSCLEKKAGIKFSDILFDFPENRLPRNIRNFGKSFCLRSSKEAIEKTLKALGGVPTLVSLTDSIEQHKDIKDDRIERIRKSLAFFSLSEDDLMQTKLALNRGCNIAMSYG